MLIVGLTGGIGSGKTTVSNVFAAMDVPIIDTDLISRDIVGPQQPALQIIRDEFGDTVITGNGHLDRKALKEIIFSKPEKRKQLEDILHPLIKNEVKRKIQLLETGPKLPYCIIVVPLLIESGWTDLVDRVLVVDVAEETQIQRAGQRDNLTHTQLTAILNSQTDRHTRLEVADDVIDNSGNLTALKHQVTRLHLDYQSLGVKLT